MAPPAALAAGCSAFSFATAASQPGGNETPSRRRTTLKWRSCAGVFHSSRAIGASTFTPRATTTLAAAISFVLARLLSTVLSSSDATTSGGASRAGRSAVAAGGWHTPLCPPSRTSSLHQLRCSPAATAAAPRSASHDGPITRRFSSSSSVLLACVPNSAQK